MTFIVIAAVSFAFGFAAAWWKYEAVIRNYRARAGYERLKADALYDDVAKLNAIRAASSAAVAKGNRARAANKAAGK